VFQQPSSGWDPVSSEHAEAYAKFEWNEVETKTRVDSIEQLIGPLRDKRVLDLGGGPGHFTVEFAKRGCRVTWHDISRNYLQIAKSAAYTRNLSVEFSIGYLEEALKYRYRPFDIVFVRGCWCYCMDDRFMGHVIRAVVAEGGVAFIDTHVSAKSTLKEWLNDLTGIKIGHPYPPAGRVSRELLKASTAMLSYTRVRTKKDSEHIVWKKS